MADPPKDLIDAIREGRALIVCGAGVTRFAVGKDAPDWRQLIEAGVAAAVKAGGDSEFAASCAALLKSDKSARWLAAADMIQDELGGRGPEQYRMLLQTLV